MPEPALKPCPKCGNVLVTTRITIGAVIGSWPGGFPMYDSTYAIGCTECGHLMPDISTEAEAVRLWNQGD